MHLLQPCSALKEEKPQTFRDAGKSHMTLIRAIRTITLMPLPSFIVHCSDTPL